MNGNKNIQKRGKTEMKKGESELEERKKTETGKT